MDEPEPEALWFVAARMFLLLQMPGNTYDWRYLLDQHGTQDQVDNPDLYQRIMFSHSMCCTYQCTPT